jgi:hypothetical protein
MEGSASSLLSLSELETVFRGQNHKDISESLQLIVLANIATVMNCACRSQLNISYSISHACSTILKSATRPFLSRILRAPAFSEYVTSFLQNISSHRMEMQSLFFGHVSVIIQRSKGEFWQIISSATFEFYLVNAVYLDACSTFLQSFLFEPAPETEGGPMPLSIVQNLVQQIVTRSRNSIPSMQIIKASLDCERLAGLVAGSVLAQIEEILTETFCERDARYLDFLVTLYGKALDDRHIPTWVRVGDAIASRYANTCEVLTKAERFAQFERAASKLFLSVAKDRMYLGELASQVVQRSLTLLFKFPSNSFLHNFAVSAVELLVDRRDSVQEIIESTNLVGQIIENYHNPQWDGRAFWGQLRMVANLIDPYVNPRNYPDWTSVTKSNQQTEELIHRRDGLFGKVPFLSSCSFLKLLDSPTTGKFVIWGIALIFIVIVYASCAM